MSEMVERVARAICVANGNSPDRDTTNGPKTWTLYVREARAAIATMRVPTPEMFEKLWAAVADAENERSDAERGWRNAIDAALV